MYINARQTSQGEQRTYNVSSQSQDAPPPPPFHRQVQFQDDLEDDLLPLRPTSMVRQYTVAMKQMEEEEEDDDDEPGDLQLCSMAAPRLKRSNNYFVPPDLDFLPPSGVQYCSMTRAEEDEAEEDDILSQHKLGDCMTSPYSNLRQVTMMRGCSYQPPADEDEDKDENKEVSNK
jgi:hypothetical protein